MAEDGAAEGHGREAQLFPAGELPQLPPAGLHLHSGHSAHRLLLLEKSRTWPAIGTERHSAWTEREEMGEPGQLVRLCWLQCQVCPQRWWLLRYLFSRYGHSLHPQLEASERLAAVVVFSPCEHTETVFLRGCFLRSRKRAPGQSTRINFTNVSLFDKMFELCQFLYVLSHWLRTALS